MRTPSTRLLMLASYYLPVLLAISVVELSATATAQDEVSATTGSLPAFPLVEDPKLSGYHFRITALEYDGYIDITEDPTTGELNFSGYLMDILKELSLRANFTYELLRPSGYGSLCNPRLTSFPPANNVTTLQIPMSQSQSAKPKTTLQHPNAYHPRYRQAYQCGESDVNDRPLSHYSTDMYWGLFYITPERLKMQRFTIPFSPPGSAATLGMLGHATHINSIHDLPQTDYAVCAYESTAYMDSLALSFPEMRLHGISFDDDVYTVLDDGTCDVIIDSYPILRQMVLNLSKNDKCLATTANKPIGVIGEPLEYGLNYFAFGVRMDIPETVVQTLNFWMQALMACFPQDPNGYCPNGIGSFSQMYVDQGGTGDECGYIQFPTTETDNKLVPAGGIAAMVIAPVLLVVVVGMLWHRRQLNKQEKRMKKRFVQQVARSLDIGPSARHISAEKLTEVYQHIGGQDNLICKQDLAKWMNDLNLDFLSEQDFDRLWDTMDMDGTGYVDPIEFYQFLSECQKQFQEVHNEYSALPKSEKVKLASRRLSNIKALGEEEVAKMERRNNRRSRMIQLSPSSTQQQQQQASNNLQGSTAVFSDVSQRSR